MPKRRYDLRPAAAAAARTGVQIYTPVNGSDSKYDLRPAAAAAARGRKVVLSVGSIDGRLLAALRKVQTAAAADGTAATSTWAEGVKGESDNEDCQCG